jgi:hypothetical protein
MPTTALKRYAVRGRARRGRLTCTGAVSTLKGAGLHTSRDSLQVVSRGGGAGVIDTLV